MALECSLFYAHCQNLAGWVKSIDRFRGFSSYRLFWGDQVVWLEEAEAEEFEPWEVVELLGLP
jgi:hypothetical protein